MGHNRIYKGGPTLDECAEKGIKLLRLQCLTVRCRRVKIIVIGDLKAKRNVPVNHLPWICERDNGGCGGANIAVSVVEPDRPAPVVPVLDLAKMRPARRRCHCGH